MTNSTNNLNRSAKGAILERGVAHLLIGKGWSVLRGAGSKSYGRGKIDLIAIHPEQHKILILQCKNFKNGSMTAGQQERSELCRIFTPTFKESYSVRCELITSLNDMVLLDDK